MMPPGSTPSAAATASRASSTAARAARATWWAPEGLPNRSVSQGSMAAAASGRSGPLAAWSRYANTASQATGGRPIG